MKALFAVSTPLALGLVFHAGVVRADEEKEEMQRSAEEYRKYAKENKSVKLDEGELEAPEVIKAAATKVVGSRQKLGTIEEQLAAAYEAGDKKRIQQLQNQKHDAELECELSEKEKMAAYVINGVADLIKELPASVEAKELKVKTEADLKSYLDNAKKMMELQKAQMRLEKGMEAIDSSIEIIKRREELKKLEEEATQNKEGK